MLRRSLDAAKVGDTDKLEGMKRLHAFASAVEKRHAPEADFDAVMQTEEAISRSLGGRSVFDDARERRRGRRGPQLDLFKRA